LIARYQVSVGTGIEKAEQFLPAPFTIDGNPLSSHGVDVSLQDLVLKVFDPQGRPADVAVAPGEHGTFSVHYVPLEVGKHVVHGTVKGQEIVNKNV